MPVVAASSSGRALAATTLTVSHTVPAGTDRYMVVLCNISSAATITATTYGGVALTNTNDVTAANNSGRLVVFELNDPTVGTANFVLTVSGSSSLTACVLTLTDCNVLTTLDTAEGTSTAPSITVISATGGLVLDIVGNALNNSTFTVGAGQTSIVEQESIADANRKLSVSSEAGAASVTMSWTTSVSGVWISGALTAFNTIPTSIGGRVSQYAVETLSQPVPDARIGQYAIEVLSATTPVPGRVSQYVVELLSGNVTVSTETTRFFIIS